MNIGKDLLPSSSETGATVSKLIWMMLFSGRLPKVLFFSLSFPLLLSVIADVHE